jgi:hypothetical protein
MLRVSTVSAYLLTIAVMLVVAVGSQIFIADFIKPRTVFAALLAGVILSGAVSLLIDTEIAV